MKKYLFSIFVMVLATMVGCQKSDVDGLLEESNNSANKITVTADIANDGQTRVALTPGTDNEGKPIVKVDWRTSGENEKFDVFGNNGSWVGPMQFVQIEGTNQFEGSLPNNGACNSYMATYPIGAYRNAGLLVYDSSIFTSQNGQLSEDKTLMLAYLYTLNENTKFSFIHSTALLKPKFRVQGATENLLPEEIKTITFKSMPVNGGTADFEIDCTERGAEDDTDDIYVYLPTYNYEIKGLQKIEVVVTTRDAKIYDGEINIGGTTLYAGKLYTANIWLIKRESTNIITYTTTNDAILTLDSNAWGEGDDCIYTSHTFTDGVGRIVLKEDVTTLPANAFNAIQTLANVTLSKEITEIEASAFRLCRGLVEVIMPNVTTIGDRAFDMDKTGQTEPDGGWGSSCLKNVDLSKITTIGTRTFYGCQMTQLDLSSATSINEKAFAELRQLISVTMPKQDCTIGKQSFALCTSLTTINLTNISAIGETAFQSCNNLTAVIINRETPPTVVVKNDKTPFDRCHAELTVFVPEKYISNYQDNPLYVYINPDRIIYTTTDNVILTLDSNVWTQYADYITHTFSGNVGIITLMPGVGTTLQANAFAGQKRLKTIALPMRFTEIGDSAFQQCCYLESISMPNITVIGNSAFDMDGLHYPDYNLGETLKVASLDLSKVTTLGDRALFKLVSLQSIDISGATSIGSEVFYECGNLTSVKMPKQDCTLGASAFIRCGLTNIDLSNITSIGACAFGWINKPTSIIINRATPPAIGETILLESSSEMKIYVPDGSVNTYKAVTNLVQYADNIKPLSELPK